MKNRKRKTRSRIIVIIPARYDSTRLPGKPLLDINGIPMIQRVYEQALQSNLIDRVVVATDNHRIYDAVYSFGGEAVMTSRNHTSGTDRIGEAIRKRIENSAGCKIVVNVQGDEPFLYPPNIDKAIKPLLSDKSLNVSTLAIPVTNKAVINDPNVVKVVFDIDRNALYFSRNPIPYNRDKSGNVKYYKHIGLYVYRHSYLMKLINMYPSTLELAEKLEQLRILQSGERIRVVLTDKDSHSVDTKKDLADIRKMKHA